MGLMEDRSTNARNCISYEHHEVHAGSHFEVSYSVASIGALTTPDDAITLSWKTPDSLKEMHIIFSAICEGGARVRFIEGKTGGGATPTGVLAAYNSNRRSDTTSLVRDVAGANVGNMSYDATIFTGGTTILDEYLAGVGPGVNDEASGSRGTQEWILERNTLYQLSIFDTGTVPATLKVTWYEHTPNN